jgi:hypothetical protein
MEMVSHKAQQAGKDSKLTGWLQHTLLVSHPQELAERHLTKKDDLANNVATLSSGQLALAWFSEARARLHAVQSDGRYQRQHRPASMQIVPF